MKERPILFSTPMVQAILDGRKTQTRRVVKPQPPRCTENGTPYSGFQATTLPIETGYDLTAYMDNPKYIGKCPYGNPGDRLWVRETWADLKTLSDDNLKGIIYRADGIDHYGNEDGYVDTSSEYMKWKPSIFMPKHACRLFLEVIDVRIERLQNITEEDAEKEGIQFLRDIPDADETLTSKELFMCLWDSINEKRGYSWESNPWVWVVEFRRI